jgi:tRNA threonylcarbamoyladenosine modification (KEOPS) complex  Pcc1 subunit
MPLKCSVQVTLNNVSKKKATAIKNALEPDNVNFPKGLSFEIKSIDNKLVFNFQSIGDTSKLTATVDEVLEHVKLVSEIIK